MYLFVRIKEKWKIMFIQVIITVTYSFTNSNKIIQSGLVHLQ